MKISFPLHDFLTPNDLNTNVLIPIWILIGVQGTLGTLIFNERYLQFWLNSESVACNQVVQNPTGWRGSKNEWIPSKYYLKNYIHIYLTKLSTKLIGIDCQNRQSKCFRSRENCLRKL